MNATSPTYRSPSRLLALSLLVSSFSLAGCSALQERAEKAEPFLTDVSNTANTAATVSPIFGPNVAAIASLIAAIAGGILTIDKTFEKLSAGSVANNTSTSTTSTTTPKSA